MKKVNKSFKIIVDTNIWISFLIGKNLKGLQNHIDSKNIEIITCNEQLSELQEIFKKPKIKKYFNSHQITDFFELLDECSYCIQITSKIDICRDIKDNYLIALAFDSKSDFLITGDDDLLDLKKYKNTTFIKFSDFDKIINP